MNWIKQGLIYNVSGKNGYDVSHCHKPTAIIIDNETIRLYFGVRDRNNRTRTTFIDLDSKDLKNTKYIHNQPVLDLGKIGTFDDCGAQVCSVVYNSKQIFMYYIGWNTSTTVSSRNALGLAVSNDNGITFNRVYEGPILERYKEEAFHVGAVDVLFDKNVWKMWYNSGIGFTIVNGKPEYRLHIKYATSKNGVDWYRQNICCIRPVSDTEIIGRPSVIKTEGKFLMWYSRRNIVNFRTDINSSYRVGYAESIDGIDWERMDETSGIDVSENKDDWDSQMIAYPYILKMKDRLLMFYNGNGFGASGVGFATLEYNR